MLEITDEAQIARFKEKSKEDGGWINGGFMVLKPEIMDYIRGDDCVFEQYPLEQLAKESQLMAYKHDGFWQCMDTMRDKDLLEALWTEKKAPWKVW
ncbi:Glucose-1-phosphate cytidylyltransferase [bioreactor metagenome]|uniref:Glucose-1-phosphate cytidylyltransferase n=1 Tax=bioreactor metagenome TaxID=1076179 RepID=A0A645DTQ6_9ZZZZ